MFDVTINSGGTSIPTLIYKLDTMSAKRARNKQRSKKKRAVRRPPKTKRRERRSKIARVKKQRRRARQHGRTPPPYPAPLSKAMTAQDVLRTIKDNVDKLTIEKLQELMRSFQPEKTEVCKESETIQGQSSPVHLLTNQKEAPRILKSDDPPMGDAAFKGPTNDEEAGMIIFILFEI